MFRHWQSRYPGWSVHMGKIPSSVSEISVTGPARLLIWTHRNFCKERDGEARSRKPSQPGRSGSYEEALNMPPHDADRCLLAYSFPSDFVNSRRVYLSLGPFSSSIALCCYGSQCLTVRSALLDAARDRKSTHSWNHQWAYIGSQSWGRSTGRQQPECGRRRESCFGAWILPR